jgi:MarR family 2-MHQ and catechol resistance regulon transcriptional repressor
MPTKYAGTKSEVRALNAHIKLLRAAESMTARLTALIADQTGLTISQFGALESIFHLGPICQKEIAEKQLKSGGNITLVIDNLEKRELVRRERSQADRRLVIVHLTVSGKKLISDYFPCHAKAVEHEMGVLTNAEQDQLADLGKKLGLQIGRSGYPKGCYT